MESRLRLRRRLLVVDSSNLCEAIKVPMKPQPPTRPDKTEPKEKEPESSDGEDVEDGEEEDNNNSDVENEILSKHSSTCCEVSTTIKLLLSRSNPHGRLPTVWFDYPSHLELSRSLSSTQTLITCSTNDFPLYYQTHWERNCVKNAFHTAGFQRITKRWKNWHMAWAKHVSRTQFAKFQGQGQVFNHLPDPWIIGRKDRLMKLLTTYRRRFGTVYNFFPEGFVLPDQWESFHRLIQREEDTSLWILKPPASACGRGIRVLSSQDINTIATDRKYIIQRYIASPLLVNGFKFDLRIYVVVTSIDPLRIYMFQEGLTRFCTTPYGLTNLKNRFSHLTNYSVNKKKL